MRLCFPAAWFLFKEDWDLVEQRHAAKADPEDQSNIKLNEQTCYWVIYRQANKITDHIYEEKLCPLQWQLLQRLHQGQSVNDSLAEMEALLSDDDLQILETNLSTWFAQWTNANWFCAAS